MTLAVTFLAVCLTYIGAFGTGWYFSRRGRLSPDRLFPVSRRIVDPFTARFQRWHDVAKMNAIHKKRWARLWLLISVNNLFAVALVSRTLYGVTLVLPAYFTCQQGFRHGALMARPSMRMVRPFISVFVLEFGAYLLATALGVNVVVGVLMGASMAQPMQSLVIFYPIVIAAICGGAWLEVRWLRDRVPDVSSAGSLNMEELRSKALEMMKQEWSRGRHDTPLPPPSGSSGPRGLLAV